MSKGGIIKFVAALALCIALFAAAPARADNSSALKENPKFKDFLAKGGKIEFLGNELGVDGWVLVDANGDIVTAIYSTPSGALIKGWLFDPEGRSLTPKQIEAYQARLKGSQASLPGADKGMASKAENLYAAVEAAHWVRIGSKDAPYIYIFMNVSCPHCQDFWKKLQPAVDAGMIQVRLVPFGWQDINRNGGAALLSVNAPGEAWKDYMNGKPNVLSLDNLKDDALKKEALKRIDENNKLAREWRLPEPPFTLYRKLSDSVVTAIVGTPANIMMLQADLMKPQKGG